MEGEIIINLLTTVCEYMFVGEFRYIYSNCMKIAFMIACLLSVSSSCFMIISYILCVCTVTVLSIKLHITHTIIMFENKTAFFTL